VAWSVLRVDSAVEQRPLKNVTSAAAVRSKVYCSVTAPVIPAVTDALPGVALEISHAYLLSAVHRPVFWKLPPLPAEVVVIKENCRPGWSAAVTLLKVAV